MTSALQDNIALLRERLPLIPRDASFANSLIDQASTKRGLTSTQKEWIAKLLARAAAVQAPTLFPVDVPAVSTIDLSPIVALLNTASTSLKHPRVFLRHQGEDYVLSLAGSMSKCPGSVNVQTRGSFENRTWYGRITKEGVFQSSKVGVAKDELLPLLRSLAEKPLETLQTLGKKFGICCCCGRELTNKTSIEMGIGPICADKFGL